MIKPDFENVKGYVIGRLVTELAPEISYHSSEHTLVEVVPAAEKMAEMENINGEELILIRTAAYFHDMGFLEQYRDHENGSVRIAGQVLPGFGYTPEQILTIQTMILSTKLPQSPKNLKEMILSDADLSIFGKENYLKRNQDLRSELAAQGIFFTDEKWFSSQLNFIKSHSYFTRSGHLLQDAVKSQNIIRLSGLLAECLVDGR